MEFHDRSESYVELNAHLPFVGISLIAAFFNLSRTFPSYNVSQPWQLLRHLEFNFLEFPSQPWVTKRMLSQGLPVVLGSKAASSKTNGLA